MKMLKPSPNYGRNDFDLSHRHVHSANFGELIPTFCVETLPKDKIKIRVSDLVRAQPMVTSPFLRAKQHVDVWFVPYQLMWSRFNEFIADKDEPNSSALHDRLFVPHAKLSAFGNSLYSDWYSNPFVATVHGDNGPSFAGPIVGRNLELMGYPGNLIIDEEISGDKHYPDVAVNLWRLAAYNLIWYREYRQQYYDDGKLNLPSSIANLSNGASYLFNFDWLLCDTAANADLGTIAPDLLTAMMTPRYRCWKKDIYTGLLPDTQFGNVSVVDSIANNPVVLANTKSGGADAGIVSGNTLIMRDSSNNIIAGSNYWNLNNNSGSSLNSKFDILALRKSEAIQKWRENALRAGNEILDNFEAHYGVKPASHMDVHPKHVASFDAPLNVGDINAQAQTGESVNGVLGDVAGKGIMSFGGNEEFTFETNDFGVLMGIYSILPEAEYNGNNLDRLNCLLEREDYFFPEYENLGLEAVDFMNISCEGYQNPGILGYAPRYYGYKQKHDRCVGEFMQYQGYNGKFRHWCSPKYDVDLNIANGTLALSTLYVNPSIFDVNFSLNWLQVNQFLVDMYVECEAIRQMSVSGMPAY